MAAGGLESGLNTAVNAVPLAEMVGGSVRNAWEKTYVFFVFCTQRSLSLLILNILCLQNMLLGECSAIFPKDLLYLDQFMYKFSSPLPFSGRSNNSSRVDVSKTTNNLGSRFLGCWEEEIFVKASR